MANFADTVGLPANCSCDALNTDSDAFDPIVGDVAACAWVALTGNTAEKVASMGLAARCACDALAGDISALVAMTGAVD